MSESRPERIWALDLARGFCLFLMVMLHIIDDLGSDATQESGFAKVIYLLATFFSARIFIFVLGIGVMFSKRMSLIYAVQRGLLLFFLGFALNVMRGTLPTYLALQFGAIKLTEIGRETPLYLFQEHDVLQFAGLAFILLALVHKFIKSPLVWMILGVVILWVSPSLWGTPPPWSAGAFLFEMLWGKEHYTSSFPIFPWFSYALFGMVLGYYLKRSSNYARVFYSGVIPGIILMMIGPWVLNDPGFKLMIVDKYSSEFTPTGISLLLIGSAFVWMATCHFLVQHIKKNFIFDKLYFWSKHITLFYVIHWILIGWLSIEIEDMSLMSVLSIIVVVFLAIDRILVYWDLGHRRNPPPEGRWKVDGR